MASVFDRQGQYDKALEWYGRTLDGYENTLGKDHPDTLTTVHNMAFIFRSQGQYNKALEWFERALDGREKSLGKGHPFTLTTVCGMAVTFDNQGQYEKALELYQRAIGSTVETSKESNAQTHGILRRIEQLKSNIENRP
jgi:tetratricopeptide (TPR) repeat protein